MLIMLRSIVGGSVASISESEERLVFRHNYPAKAINCL
ncbi:Chromosome (plasmid) partitioning protein ParA [methanotrophic endosymbiont of Bathymodiolus azoricus (Menez Gwen)]|nr:Chromosome (plasmid) partitioning protein ParA [methanotrophic endosymbiont of Bathymodiolus azoricus (Menez Gwen)]